MRVIHHASGASSDYRIGDVNYSIDSVADMDGQPGAEILVRDANGKLFDQRPHRQGKQLSRAGCVGRYATGATANQRAGGPSARA